jgi:HD-GYP domain-containing protein (c-di-GMP phosphodiesterase class II)
MTAVAGITPRASQVVTEGMTGATVLPQRGTDAYLRVAGRKLIGAIAGALRSIKLYPVENEVVQAALNQLCALVQEVADAEGDIEVRASGDFLFVNGTRLRLDLENYTSFAALLSSFRASGIGSVRFAGTATRRDWTVLLAFLGTAGGDPDWRLELLLERLREADITAFDLAAPGATDGDNPSHSEAKEAAKRTYVRGVTVTRDVINSMRMGQSPSITKIKRVVQGIVDQILNEETSLLGLTTIRDYDDYTFTHSINVCIFSVALGRRLGLTRMQLYDLGMAALFHDFGKSRVPLEVLNKVGVLSDDEWRMIAAHPWLGVLALFQLRDQQEHPYRAMVVAYEHHMKIDLTGYPRSPRTKRLSMFSKIVAVADGFDAATSRRVYQSEPIGPAVVLQEMRDNPRRGMDPVVVKAFVNLLGVYPVGTLVILDTFELAVVHAVNPLLDRIARPLVRIVSDTFGNMVFPGELVDLADQNPDGTFARTIIKTEDPERCGIRIGDYFV